MNRRYLPLFAIVVLALAALACGGKETPEKPPEPTEMPTETQSPATDIPEPIEIPLTQLPELDTDLELPTEGTVDTVRGAIQVPGAAYVDGRDEEADPPLTVMSIDVWDAMPRTKVACELEHGTEVAVLMAEMDEDEDRYYFMVLSGLCMGWISEPFLSPEYHEPVGDQM